MKNLFLPLIVFSLLFGSAKLNAQCAKATNIYRFTYSGKNYEVVKERRTWLEARECAVERGGYLVEINDSNEQNAVYNGIVGAGVSPTYIEIPEGGAIAYVWIGATDQFQEGTWLWNGKIDTSGINFWNGQGANGAGNGTAVNNLYNNWGGKSTGTPNEPDNFFRDQNHAAIALAGWPAGTTLSGKTGEWNDIFGFNYIYYVIENATVTGLLDQPKPMELTLFPNPCNNKLSILGLNLTTQSSYEIYDITGKLVLADNLNSLNEIDVERLSKGLYFLKIEASGTSYKIFIKE